MTTPRETPAGARLRQIRERRRLGQDDAAAELGINQSNLSKLERGARRPSMAVAKKIQEHYGIPMEAWV
jgi:transcriptional regulator with XRE-family HTH domain